MADLLRPDGTWDEVALAALWIATFDGGTTRDARDALTEMPAHTRRYHERAALAVADAAGKAMALRLARAVGGKEP